TTNGAAPSATPPAANNTKSTSLTAAAAKSANPVQNTSPSLPTTTTTNTQSSTTIGGQGGQPLATLPAANNTKSTSSVAAQTPQPLLKRQPQQQPLQQQGGQQLLPPSSTQSQPQSQLPYSYPYQYPYQLQQQPLQQQGGQQLLPPSSTQSQPLGNNRQPPIAYAGVSQTVYGGTMVTLDGRASYDPDNYAASQVNKGIAAYQWTQIPATPGAQMTAVVLQGANTANPTFVSPVLPYDTILAFSLKVTDSDGGAASNNPAIVYVYVKHNPNNSPTIGGNIPGTIANPQEQQPLVPKNNNLVTIAPSQTNSPSPTFPPRAPQIGSLNTPNALPSGR
ncbi:MAG TPA: hypothetical protein VE593_11780, partial [Nitrososphaeraceae archaeon]|nr:hypothetical protein [Nitrososphaeraceae archaeon]